MADWLDNYIDEQLKNPNFKKEWDKYQPAHEVVMFMLENNISFNQEFLDILDELTEKGVVFGLIPSEKAKKVEKPEMEYA